MALYEKEDIQVIKKRLDMVSSSGTLYLKQQPSSFNKELSTLAPKEYEVTANPVSRHKPKLNMVHSGGQREGKKNRKLTWLDIIRIQDLLY